MEKSRYAQISIEYTLIIGLILLALALAVGIALVYSGNAKQQITMNQIEKVGKKIAETTESIYYLGYPSKATIELNMPENIEEILIFDEIGDEKDYIRFKFKTQQGTLYSKFYTRAKLVSLEQPLNESTFISSGLKYLVISTTITNQITFTQTFSN